MGFKAGIALGMMLMAVAGCRSGPVVAQEAGALSLPAFRSIAVEGGGTVVIRKGPTQRVTLQEGSSSVSELGVQDGSLRIRACPNRCPANYRLRVAIVVPALDALAVNGGGSIAVADGFGAADRLALAVNGGGAIDAERVDSRDVTAAVRGGGSIRLRAGSRLTAAVNGGGSIAYRGSPSVTSAIRGGGSVARIGG